MTNIFAARMVYNIATDSKQKFTLEEANALRMAVTALRLEDEIRQERDMAIQQLADLGYTLGEKPRTSCSEIPNSSKHAVIDAIVNTVSKIGLHDNSEVARYGATFRQHEIIDIIEGMPSAQSEVIRCKDCKHWRQQTNYQGTPLSFGFCESEDMWCSLYGETVEVSHIDTDDDFYCGYAERRTDA